MILIAQKTGSRSSKKRIQDIVTIRVRARARARVRGLGLGLGLTLAHVSKLTLEYFKIENSREVTVPPHSSSTSILQIARFIDCGGPLFSAGKCPKNRKNARKSDLFRAISH